MADSTKLNQFSIEVRHSKLLLDLIANKWTVCVIYELREDTKRYSRLHHAIEGITQKALTETLKRMERNGLLERIIYPVIPPKVEYRLTSLGMELLRMADSMAEWTATHIDEVHQARTTYDSARLISDT